MIRPFDAAAVLRSVAAWGFEQDPEEVIQIIPSLVFVIFPAAEGRVTITIWFEEPPGWELAKGSIGGPRSALAKFVSDARAAAIAVLTPTHWPPTPDKGTEP